MLQRGTADINPGSFCLCFCYRETVRTNRGSRTNTDAGKADTASTPPCLSHQQTSHVGEKNVRKTSSANQLFGGFGDFQCV